MKKRFLSIGFLVLTFSLNAQTLTYVDEGAKFYVSSGALVYSGGDWELNANTAATVENRGNIMIVGNYKKGTRTNAASDGNEFVNVYTNDSDYGQVIIRSGSNTTTDARMVMQKPAASSSYFGATYPISFPFRDNANYLMRSFGLSTSDFVGNCAPNNPCGTQIFNVTLRKWNNNTIQHDPVTTTNTFAAGDYYLLNLRPANMQAVMINTINYKGTPAPASYSSTGKSVIPSETEESFSALQYNDWRNRTNQYNEAYFTYLGNIESTSRTYGKNVYRFGNPYTSNLDLSAFDGANAWLKVLNVSERTIKGATDDAKIKNFNISKRTANFDINWGRTGSTNSGTYYVAQYDGQQWTGNAQALLIKPLETFNLNFPIINPTNLGNTRIVNIRVDFNDNHKTFNYSPSAPGTATEQAPPITVQSVNATGRMAAATSSSVSSSPFYQSEIILVKDNVIQSTPAYLVGSSLPTETSSAMQDNDAVYVYGINGSEINRSSKKKFTAFNVNEYVGKPMGIGFNNLIAGANYSLNFNLYEGSIFSSPNKLSGEKFYLYDTLTKQSVEITGDKSYDFIADKDSDKRFEIYWGIPPSGSFLKSHDVVNNASTFIYKDENVRKLRFANVASKADVEVYDMAGKLVSSFKNVPTSTDMQLQQLASNGVYILKVSYSNGLVATIKTIN